MYSVAAVHYLLLTVRVTLSVLQNAYIIVVITIIIIIITIIVFQLALYLSLVLLSQHVLN
jgi:hypothetical protein